MASLHLNLQSPSILSSQVNGPAGVRRFEQYRAASRLSNDSEEKQIIILL